MLNRSPHGIIPAIVTPLTSDEEINESSLRRLVNHVIRGGVHGVFATGSQGEYWAFSPDEKRRIWEVVVDETRGRVPVYAGTMGATTRETIALTQQAEKSGVDAVSILTPFTLNPNDDELFRHYRAVAASTSLPIMIYSNPGRTRTKVSVSLLERLAPIPNLVGIKDSGGDLEALAEYLRAVPAGFSVMVGPETLLYAALHYGAQGCVSACANVAPSLVVEIFERFKTGDFDAARQAQARLAPLRLSFGLGTYPVVIKEALDLMGLEAGPARAPAGPLSPEQREQLRRVLEKMRVLE
jgi:4-hydroxy-tetrahydrodipicolinate synthase